jgi:hypothetical protein
VKIFHFEVMNLGSRDPIETASAMLRDETQAKEHCRSLYEGHGNAIGAKCVRVREAGGSVLFSWPEPN